MVTTAYTQDEADRFLMGTGGKSAKLKEIGDEVRGYLLAKPVIRQRTDIKTKQPLFWDNGDPQNQLVVQLQTEERDPQIEDDDGIRNVYLRGSRDPATKSSLAAAAEAVRQAGVKGLDAGGFLHMRVINIAPPTAVGLSGAKEYQAWYWPPSDMMLQQQQAAAASPPPPAQTAAPPPPPPSAVTPPAPQAPAPQQAPVAPPPPPAPTAPAAPPPPPAPAPPAPAAAPPPPAPPGPPPPPAPPAPPAQQMPQQGPPDQWANEEPPF